MLIKITVQTLKIKILNNVKKMLKKLMRIIMQKLKVQVIRLEKGKVKNSYIFKDCIAKIIVVLK